SRNPALFVRPDRTACSPDAVQDASAVVARPDRVVALDLVDDRGRNGHEAAVAGAVDHGDDGAAAAFDLLITPSQVLRQLRLDLLDLLVELGKGALQVDVELLDFDPALVGALGELAALRFQVLQLQQDLELWVHPYNLRGSPLSGLLGNEVQELFRCL